MLTRYITLLTAWAALVHGALICTGIGGSVCVFFADTGDSGELQDAVDEMLAELDDSLNLVRSVAQPDIPYGLRYVHVDIDFSIAKSTDANLIAAKNLQDYGKVALSIAEVPNRKPETLLIVNPSYFVDASNCILKQQIAYLNGEANFRQAPRVDPNEGAWNFDVCVNDYFKKYAQPVSFPITDQASSIELFVSDIAPVLTPVDPEEGHQHVIRMSPFALGIWGSSLSVYEKVAGDQKAHLFERESDAFWVADLAKDRKWLEDSCSVCELPTVADSTKKRHARDTRIHKRDSSVLVAGICCPVPASKPVDVVPDDLNTGGHYVQPPGSSGKKPDPLWFGDEIPMSQKGDEPPSLQVYDTTEYRRVQEQDLSPPKEYKVHTSLHDSGITAIQNDLATLNTAAVAWSVSLMRACTSDTMLAEFKEILSGPPHSEIWDLMRINYEEDTDGRRVRSVTRHWVDESSADMGEDISKLVPYNKMADAIFEFGYETFGKLKGWSDSEMDYRKGNQLIGGEIEWFWTEPNERARLGTDPRGLHVDGGDMQFIVADLPGLIVQNEPESNYVDPKMHTYSRVPVLSNAFYCVKARHWDPIEQFDYTRHTVFGPEMAEDPAGRISMVMTIWSSQLPDDGSFMPPKSQ